MSAKESQKCKILGQFFTPEKIAQFMSKWVCKNNPNTILDPGLGHCALIKECHNLSPHSKMIGFDIDDEILKYVEDNIQYTIDLKIEDYLSNWEQKYDAIICNPPYNKFQTIKDRDVLIKNFEKNIGVRLSGYTNIMGYFLVKSVFELNENGRSAYIVPYEFLNTGYGSAIKEYLIKRKVLVAIIKFDNSKNVFDDVITTTCILLLENSEHESLSFIDISDTNELDRIDFSNISPYGIDRSYNSLNCSEKWIKYFNTKNEEKNNRHNLIKLHDIAIVKRGIATGDNDYFTLNKTLINKHNLSDSCIIPCICKAPDINKMIFTKNDFDELVKKDKKVFLFNGSNATTENDYAYIQYGINKGSSKRYLTSHRNPWYLIENKDVAPILIAVFNRDGIKIIRNEAEVSNLTAFHGLYISERFSNALDADILYCYLCSDSAKKLLFDNKREYGDKLDKFEPNDLNNAFILNPKCIKIEDIKSIKDIYSKFKIDSNKDEFISSLNNVFDKYLADQ